MEESNICSPHTFIDHGMAGNLKPITYRVPDGDNHAKDNNIVSISNSTAPVPSSDAVNNRVSNGDNHANDNNIVSISNSTAPVPSLVAVINSTHQSYEECDKEVIIKDENVIINEEENIREIISEGEEFTDKNNNITPQRYEECDKEVVIKDENVIINKEENIKEIIIEGKEFTDKNNNFTTSLDHQAQQKQQQINDKEALFKEHVFDSTQIPTILADVEKNILSCSKEDDSSPTDELIRNVETTNGETNSKPIQVTTDINNETTNGDTNLIENSESKFQVTNANSIVETCCIKKVNNTSDEKRETEEIEARISSLSTISENKNSIVETCCIKKENTSDEKSSSPPRRSSRLKINKKIPTPKMRQTPMGLPKPNRLKKDEFSLDEIYTNKNYSTPRPKSWETIYEVPKASKNGEVKFIDKRLRKRAIEFHTVPADRPAKKRSRECQRELRKKALERKKMRLTFGDDAEEKLKKKLEIISDDEEDAVS